MENKTTGGVTAPAGSLSAERIRNLGLLGGTPQRASLAWRIRNWWEHKHRGALIPLTKFLGLTVGAIVITSTLSAIHYRAADGAVIDHGIVSRRVVTTAGVGFIVDAFQNLKELENMKFHGVGIGTTAEASADTALVTESTTALNPDSTRATGTLTEGASANIFRTVGTVTFDASAAITEHGIFDQAATGGGILLDRSVFSAINVANLDSIQFTYELTFTAGS